MIVVTHTAVVQVLIHMEWIADPSIWAGLVTLVIIELVLGIDNRSLSLSSPRSSSRPSRPRADHWPDAGDGDASPAADLYLRLVT